MAEENTNAEGRNFQHPSSLPLFKGTDFVASVLSDFIPMIFRRFRKIEKKKSDC
jgi:hypothetical protein